MNKFPILMSSLFLSFAGGLAFGQGPPPPKGVEIFVDLSQIPEGQWVAQEPVFPGDPPISDDQKQLHLEPKAPIDYPEEWKKIKSFEEEGELPILKITKKQLEEEGPILALDELVKETDVSKIDKKAMRRSLLHHLIVESGREEIVIKPANLKRGDVPASPEIFEHHDKVWGKQKQHAWLAGDILIIEYLQSRPEKYWKTGALVAANQIVSSVIVSKFGDIKSKFPIGAAVSYLYVVPNMSYAVPHTYHTAQSGALDCLLNISSLYSASGNYPQWYSNLWSSILDIEKRINVEHMNIHCEKFADNYEARGDLTSALETLKRYEPRADVKPTNERIEKSIVRLNKMLEEK